MGNKMQIALVAIITFFLTGSAMEFIFHDQIVDTKEETAPAAAAFIASQDTVTPPSVLPPSGQQQPKTGSNSPSRGNRQHTPYTCTAAELRQQGPDAFHATIRRVIDGDTITVETLGAELTRAPLGHRRP